MKDEIIKTPNQLLENWFANTPKAERDAVLNEFDNRKYEGFPIFEVSPNSKTAAANGNEQIKYLKIEYKAYGAYSGSYDGGGVEGDLYWNIEDARKKCLEYVSENDKDNRKMLKFSLNSFKDKTTEHKKIRAEYRKTYAPMKEVEENDWRSTHNDVRVVEYIIK